MVIFCYRGVVCHLANITNFFQLFTINSVLKKMNWKKVKEKRFVLDMLARIRILKEFLHRISILRKVTCFCVALY